MRAISCLFLACLVVFAASEAGLKLTITPQAIASFKDDLLPKVVAQVQGLEIPEVVSGKLTISNFNLKELALPSDDLSVKFGTNKIYLSSSSFGVRAQLYIRYKLFGVLPILFTTIDCATSDSVIGFTLSVTKEGRLSVGEFTVKIQNLNVYFPESYLGFLYRGLIYMFTWPIQSLLNQIIYSQVSSALQTTLDQAMTNTPWLITLPNSTIGVDYEFSSLPKVTRDYMTIYVNGTFYDAAASQFNVPAIPAPREYPEFDSESGQQIQAFISEYVLNTALYQVYTKEMMKVTVTNDMMPPEAGIKFGTNWLKKFIPNINTYFKDSNNCTMKFAAASNPIVTIEQRDMKINLDAQLSWDYIDGDNVTEIVKIQGGLELHANVSLKNWTFTPYIVNATFGKFTVLNSNVGEITGDKFTQGFNILFLFAIGGFNAQFKPVELPKIPGVHLESSAVSFEQGHIRIQSTPTFDDSLIIIPAKPALRGAQI